MRHCAFVLVLLLMCSSALADPRLDCATLMGDSRIAACNTAIRQNPRDALSYNNRGGAYASKNEYAKANADYTSALAIDPNFVTAYYNRALVHAHEKEYDQAIADYSMAIKINPKYAPAYVNRGSAYYFKKEYDQAIADFNKVLQMGTKLHPAYYNRGAAYPRNQKQNDAIVYYDLGLAHRDKNEYDQAIADHTKAIEINPKCAACYYARAIDYFKAGKPAQGVPDADKSIELSPNSRWAFDARGKIFEVLGRRDEAIADFRRALLPGIHDPELQESGTEALKRLGASPEPVRCRSGLYCPTGMLCLADGTCGVNKPIARSGDCRPGYQPTSGGGCVPVGSADCGGGFHCLPGSRCLGNGRCSGPRATGPVCGHGRCSAGQACGPDRLHCYNPRQMKVCGRFLCDIQMTCLENNDGCMNVGEHVEQKPLSALQGETHE